MRDRPTRTEPGTQPRYDLFLSHASEDKNDVARPLYEALTAHGVEVWFDEAVLTVGDSLRRKIDEGLAACRFGLVILSPSFFAKKWPPLELDGLVARAMTSAEKTILPVWYRLEREDVLRYSVTLADLVAARWSEGLGTVVEKVLRALGRKPAIQQPPSTGVLNGMQFLLKRRNVALRRLLEHLFQDLEVALSRLADVDDLRSAVLKAGWSLESRDPASPEVAKLHREYGDTFGIEPSTPDGRRETGQATGYEGRRLYVNDAAAEHFDARLRELRDLLRPSTAAGPEPR